MQIEYISVRDVAVPQRDGSLLKQREYVFYIGKFGPFTERFALDAQQHEITARIEALRATLGTLPT